MICIYFYDIFILESRYKMKKIIIFLISLFIISGCTKNTDELVMVTEAGFAPYEYYEGGEIVGVDVDIAKYIASSIK